MYSDTVQFISIYYIHAIIGDPLHSCLADEISGKPTVTSLGSHGLTLSFAFAIA